MTAAEVVAALKSRCTMRRCAKPSGPHNLCADCLVLADRMAEFLWGTPPNVGSAPWLAEAQGLGVASGPVAEQADAAHIVHNQSDRQ